MRCFLASTLGLLFVDEIKFQFRDFTQRWLLHDWYVLGFSRFLVSLPGGVCRSSRLLAGLATPLRELDARWLLAPPIKDLVISWAE